jgi:septum formation inhibitor MinC
MMSQAPSVVFAANGDDNLVGVLPDLSGAASAAAGGASVPSGEAASDAEPNAPAEADLPKDSASSVSLRGTTRGLEIMIAGTPSTTALTARLTELFAEAPSFFAGSTARVAIEEPLPSGALACLEAVATQFEVQIAEFGPVVARRRRCTVPAVLRPDDVPQVHLAEGTGPITDQAVELAGGELEPASVAPPVLPTEAVPAALAAVPPGPRLVIGPVRSGMIVDHVGHVIVIGDVNPGAEVRAEGSIIVLGRLRGVAHAAIGREAGCIIALSLQPQQLRIGRMVARAADADRPSDGAEIAYATGETIVVERFVGRLPSGLAASM